MRNLARGCPTEYTIFVHNVAVRNGLWERASSASRCSLLRSKLRGGRMRNNCDIVYSEFITLLTSFSFVDFNSQCNVVVPRLRLDSHITCIYGHFQHVCHHCIGIIISLKNLLGRNILFSITIFNIIFCWAKASGCVFARQYLPATHRMSY